MTSRNGPDHVVVDGSNIATEGRSLPSLAQLNEAVMSFMEEYPDTAITVVVDATFGHRIDKKEQPEFEEGISNNELVAPPAGAVGRGDAFVLGIAQKAKASILSNDSFQEFHGDYEWLFDEGRLIGGKPVPHVGWVFVDRVPVRGPVSRKATSGSKAKGRRGQKKDDDAPKTGRGRGRGARSVSVEATGPMPVPTSPPPGRATKAARPAPADTSSVESGARRGAPRGGDPVNDLLPFLEFVEHHPVGTSINGTVDSYSSHGAYVTIGDQGVRGYVPLRLMADPAPTSARKVMRIGESVTLVVVSYAPERRSIDCSVPDMSKAAIADAERERAESGEPIDDGDVTETVDAPAPTRARTKRSAGEKAAAKKPAGKKAATKKSAAKKAPAKKPAAKKAPAENVAAKKAPAKKSAAKKAPAKKSAAKKAPAKKAPAKKSAAKKPAAKKAPAKKSAAKKPAAKKAPAKKSAAKKAPAKKAAAASDGSNGG